MEIKKYIEERWSPRAFSDREISKEMLLEFFQAAGKSPSCNNEQPWRFIYGQKGSDSFNLIFDALVDFNKAWCKTAAVLVVGVAKKRFTKNDEVNEHSKYDLGTAVAQFTMKAFESNVFVHQMAGFDSTVIEENLQISNGYVATVVFAVGYIGDKSQLPEKIANLESPESERKSLTEIVSDGKWKSEQQ